MEAEFIGPRSLTPNIGFNCRPKVCATVQSIAPQNENITKVQNKSSELMIELLEKTPTQRLDSEKLDLSSMRFVILSDATFANALDLKSQIGYITLIVEKLCCADIAHYTSRRFHRVWRSVIAAEIQALVHSVDIGMVITETLRELLLRIVKKEAYVDRQILFHVVTKNSNTDDCWLQIDVFVMKESY